MSCGGERVLVREVRSWHSQLAGGSCAATALLTMKCPLCWMALFGWGVTGARTQWLLGICCLAMYCISLWMLFRSRVRATVAMCAALGGTALLAVGMSSLSSHNLRVLLLVLLIAGALAVQKGCCAKGTPRAEME